jgi:hypothetical protein
MSPPTNSTRFSIGIVAHVDRAAMAASLSDVVHPAVVNVDDGTLGCAGNHAFVQSRLVGEPGWSVVLEDDAIPLNRFHSDLEHVLSLAPALIVGLYLCTGYPAQWQHRMVDAIALDTSFIRCSRLLHAVGYAIHPHIKAELAQWMGARGRKGPGMAPDEAIGVWAAAHHEPIVFTNPSLVDHRDTTTVIRARGNNFAPGRNRARKAHNTGQRLTWDDSCAIMSR